MARKIHRPKMPHTTQKTSSWLARCYPQLVLQRQAIIDATFPAPDVPAKTNRTADPTGRKVVQLEDVTRKIDAIEHARACVPVEYRQAVWNNAILGSPFPATADPETWRAYRNDFLYVIAIELNLPLVE